MHRFVLIPANYNADEDEYLTKRNGKAFHDGNIENISRPIVEQPGRQEVVIRWFSLVIMIFRWDINKYSGSSTYPRFKHFPWNVRSFYYFLWLLPLLHSAQKYAKRTTGKSKQTCHSWRRKFWRCSKTRRYSTIISRANRWPLSTKAHLIQTMPEDNRSLTQTPKQLWSSA